MTVEFGVLTYLSYILTTFILGYGLGIFSVLLYKIMMEEVELKVKKRVREEMEEDRF